MKDILFNEKKRKINIPVLIISAVIGLAAYIISGSKADDTEVQKNLADKLLRFHVIANSDSEEDQKLKLKIKDSVVSYLSTYLTEDMTLEESKEVIRSHNDEVISLAQDIISAEGFNYPVSADITSCYFPVKSYGDVTLPAGDYDAYRITIGESNGKNWWCILYPPLCFVDVSYGYVPDESKLLLSNILDDEEYNYITEGCETTYRFKYLTFLNGLFE